MSHGNVRTGDSDGSGNETSGRYVSVQHSLLRKRGLYLKGLDRFAVVPLVAVLWSAGCYHWVPIRPSYANEGTREFDEVRIGGEGGDMVYDASLNGSLLTGTKYGKPVEVDLGVTPAAKRQLTPGSIAAIVIPTVLGGIGIIATVIWLGVEFSHIAGVGG